MKNVSGSLCLLAGLILLAGLCLAFGCASANAPRSQGPSAGSRFEGVVVSMASNGSHVRLRAGQVLQVDLPERRDGHRTWQLASPLKLSVLRPDGQRYINSTAEGDNEAPAGTRQVRFMAVAPGETIVNMAKVVPGAGLSSAQDRWILQVIVE